MRAENREKRSRQIMEAAYAVLREKGYAGASMLAIAKRAGASNETLYGWFGSKQGLFTAMVAENARATATLLRQALTKGDDLRATLDAVGPVLLELVTGDRAVALNRAAAADADQTGALGRAIAEAGRDSVVPLLAQVFAGARQRGEIGGAGPVHLAEAYVTLLIGDLQIRRVIGVLSPLTKPAIRARSGDARDRLLALFPPPGAEREANGISSKETDR